MGAWWQAAFLMLVAVPFTVAIGALVVTAAARPVPLGAMLSAALAGFCLVFVYEWTHFLIHTAYRLGSRAYRTIWRNHRLHHFENEHFWHGITNNVSDRVLGTNPEARGAEVGDGEDAPPGVRPSDQAGAQTLISSALPRTGIEST